MKARLDDTERLEKMEKELEEMKKTRARQTTEYDVDALVRKLGSLALAQSNAPPRVTASAPPQSLYPVITQQHPLLVRAQSSAAPAVNQPATRAPFVSAQDQLVALKRNTHNPHPGNAEGIAAYLTELDEWTKRHGGAVPDKTKPYPLTPGSTPVGSGECFSCGHDFHGPSQCGVATIPQLENSWRRTANAILKHNGVDTIAIGRALRQGNRNTPNINFVDNPYHEWQPGSSPTVFQVPQNPYGDLHTQTWGPYASLSANASNADGEGKV
ncbi:hypothetical protein C8T65DRAFT_632454 [Cerioporus squamosus]|nr:hypothetical protein C8T65DRAFT_632454 [Cerioporus squamosus]